MGKSDNVQHLYREFLFSREILETFPAEDSDEIREYEERKEARCIVIEHMIDLLDTLSDWQRNILQLRFRGFTQQEIADRLKVHQTSVHKSINGNQITFGENPTYYGGSIKLLRKKLIERSQTHPELLQALETLGVDMNLEKQAERLKIGINGEIPINYKNVTGYQYQRISLAVRTGNAAKLGDNLYWEIGKPRPENIVDLLIAAEPARHGSSTSRAGKVLRSKTA